MKLDLDASKTWLVLEAIAMLTSPMGETLLREKFPNMNWDRMEKECTELVDLIDKALPKKETNDGTQR